jgi:amidase
MTKKIDTSDTGAFVGAVSPGDGKGPTVAVKDCIDIKGMVSRCGSQALANSAPALNNAPVIDRLLAAGCHIVGKTRMHELAYGMTGINLFEGTPRNPRWPDRIPGGSSSGSAASVAAGLVDFAIGTDTGGSIRQPAICCGVIGFKPTWGRVDRTGAHPAESSLDCIGPLARTMPMIDLAMQALDPTFRSETATGPLKIARLLPDAASEPRMAEPLLALDLGAGGTIVDILLPSLDDAFRAGMTIIGRETYLANADLLASGAPLGKDVKARLEAASKITDEEVARAEEIRRLFTETVDAILGTCDVLVTLALPMAPPLLADANDPARVLTLTRYLRPFNLSGHPAIVLPAVTADGLPSGVQLVASKGEDARLCAIARALSETNPIFQTKE